jgi:hypothetical protein
MACGSPAGKVFEHSIGGAADCSGGAKEFGQRPQAGDRRLQFRRIGEPPVDAFGDRFGRRLIQQELRKDLLIQDEVGQAGVLDLDQEPADGRGQF